MSYEASGDHWTISLVARALRVTEGRVRQMIEKGQLQPAHQALTTDGALYLFHPVEVPACRQQGTLILDLAERRRHDYQAYRLAGLPVPRYLEKWSDPSRAGSQRLLDFGAMRPAFVERRASAR